MKSFLRTKPLAAVLTVLLGIAQIGWTQTDPATRPPLEKLLPESTVVYAQIRNVPEFVQQFQSSNMGQIVADERIAPLVNSLYGAVKDQYEKVRDNVGVSMEQLQTLLHGEVCFAVSTFKDRSPGVVLMFDFDPEAETLGTLLDKGRELVESEGAEVESIQEADITIEKVQPPDGPTIFYFLNAGTFVGGTDLEMIKEILARWRGESVENIRTLAENRKFITIMNRCRGTKDMPPDMRFFIDPIDLLKGVTRGDIGATIFINLLPTLGLDGLLAAGGSVINDEEGYESISHFHLLLANPRAGILEMLALRPGNADPEAWVTDECVTYISGSLSVPKFYAELEKIVNLIQGEDALQSAVEENINKRLEIDFQEDILNQLTGRATFVTWIEPPFRINSQCTAFALELNDPKAFEETLDHIINTLVTNEENRTKDEYRGVTCWKFDNFGPRNRRRRGGGDNPNPDQEADPQIRRQYPNIAVLDKYLILSDSREFVEHSIDTFKGDKPPLVEDEQFLRASRQMKRLLGTNVPAGVLYTRPDRSLELFYELARSDGAKELLNNNAENEFVASIRDAMEEHPLPEFSEIRKYFAPAGGYVTSDDTGFHLLSFQMRGNDNR